MVNPLPISKNNYVNVFENYLCIKTVVAVIFIQRNNRAHFRQKCKLVLLHFSKCSPEIISFHIMVCYFKKHVNVTTNFQSLIYLCLVPSVFVKHNINFPCGNSLFQDKTSTHYHHCTMSTWVQSEKSIAV